MRILSSQRVAELLACSPRTVDERAQAGELPGLKFSKARVFSCGALAQRLDEMATEQAEQRRQRRGPLATGVTTPGRRGPSEQRLAPPVLPSLGVTG